MFVHCLLSHQNHDCRSVASVVHVNVTYDQRRDFLSLDLGNNYFAQYV